MPTKIKKYRDIIVGCMLTKTHGIVGWYNCGSPLFHYSWLLFESRWYKLPPELEFSEVP